jgi:hypothetical protein
MFELIERSDEDLNTGFRELSVASSVFVYSFANANAGIMSIARFSNERYKNEGGKITHEDYSP